METGSFFGLCPADATVWWYIGSSGAAWTAVFFFLWLAWDQYRQLIGHRLIWTVLPVTAISVSGMALDETFFTLARFSNECDLWEHPAQALGAWSVIALKQYIIFSKLLPVLLYAALRFNWWGRLKRLARRSE